MHNGMLQLGGEKMAKSVGNIALLHRGASSAGAATRWSCSSPPATTASRSQYTDEALAAARRPRRARSARRPGGWRPAPSPSDLAPLTERFFAALADDFNTPAALARRWSTGSARPTGASGVGDDDLREMLGVLGLENLLDAEPRARPPRTSSCSSARRRPGAASDFAEADRLRDELAAARLGGPRRRRRLRARRAEPE